MNEAQAVNEVGYQEQATEVNFGFFSWGGGGELDNMAAVALAAAVIAAKGIYNGIVYAKLKGKLPAYLKMYKEHAAPKAKDVWDHEFDEKNIVELKKQKDVLTGKGDFRADADYKETTKNKGETPKETIEAKFRTAIDAASGNPDKQEALRSKRDQALLS